MSKRKSKEALGTPSSGSLKDLHEVNFESNSDSVPNSLQGLSKFEPSGWNHPEGHHFQRVKEDDTYYSEPIVRVNGVEAFSAASSLYKGVGNLGEFHVDPKVDPKTGKVPPQPKIDYDYPTYTGPRDQIGLQPYTGRTIQGKHPVISPEANRYGQTTVNPESIHTTWRNLRTSLGRGAGSRTNKYLLEFNIPLHGAVKPWDYNVLCKSTSFPTRNMHTASMWRFGRKYNLRGETDFGDTWTLTFEDDSSLSLRKDFDRWFKEIDDTKLQHHGLDFYKNMGNPYLRLETKTLDLFEREDTAPFSWSATGTNVLNSLIAPEYTNSFPNYQTDIRVYQLDQTGNKVMGYLMQNAFVSNIGPVEYSDSDANNLVSFTVTFTFSEFLPLTGNMLDSKIRVF